MVVSHHLVRRRAALVAATLASTASFAADLDVRVSGIQQATGEIGCALFADATGFPKDNAKAQTLWLAADVHGVTCRFTGLPAGRYAVAVSHDLNGNRRLDTNLFGIPVEPWGVSNNLRPALRPPRFDEAAVSTSDERPTTIDVQVKP